MPEVTNDGVRLAVDVFGEGRPVTVLGHGLTGSRRDLALFAPFLPGTKVLFDFRGHGDSDRPGPGNYTTNHFASDVMAVADAFDANCAGGASLGSGAVLRLLTRKPDRFERLVFLLPARLERSSEARRSLLRLADLLESQGPERTAELIVAEEEAAGAFREFPASKDLRREAILSMNRDGMPHAIRGCIDDPPVRHASEVADVVAPSLVIGQEGDPVHRAEVARELADALPNAELLMFPDQWALMREVPALVARASSFLAG